MALVRIKTLVKQKNGNELEEVQFVFLDEEQTLQDLGYDESVVGYSVPIDFNIKPYVFDEDTNEWMVDLDHIRENLWDAVKSKRTIVENSIAPTPLGNVQCDEMSKTKILGLVTMAQLSLMSDPPENFSESFTMADNSVIVLSAIDAIILGKSVGYFVSKCFQVGREMRDWINDPERTEIELLELNVEEDFESRLNALLNPTP